jgi:hypothetical protein
MRLASSITTLALGLTFLAWAGPSHGQSTSSSKACGLLPVAELEGHFGGKATSIRGSETATVSVCAADIPDRLHGADLMSKPPGPVVLTVEQRLAAMKSVLEKRGSEVKNFGSVGCFTDHIDINGTNLPIATCFLEKGGYLSLQLRSDDPRQLGFDAVKQLLEKAAARRK